MKLLLTLLLAVFSCHSYAWDCHFLLTYGALKNDSTIDHRPTIAAEPLEDFLQQEHLGLVTLLRDHEAWSTSHLSTYAPLPTALQFTGDKKDKSLVTQFIEAIRVNPDIAHPLYIQFAPSEVHRIHSHPLQRYDVIPKNSSWVCVPNPPIEGVSPQEKLSPLEILSTAADEPDYGMDTQLWEDNSSSFGNTYGLGKQPFGNPRLSIGSQAPFHMAFYYESSILTTLAPFIQHSYLEYRIHLYLTLAKYAFSTKHPYWGYRFLGWAIHYMQDLTQPYHTTMVPNTSVTYLIFVDILDMIGISSTKQNVIQLITNKHMSLENYESNLVKTEFQNVSSNGIMLTALSDLKNDARYPVYSESYPRNIIAYESHEFANQIDDTLINTFPEKYVLDPNYIFYETETNVNLYELSKHNNISTDKINTDISTLLRALGSHTRIVIRYVIK